jgi:hypothetical protein
VGEEFGLNAVEPFAVVPPHYGSSDDEPEEQAKSGCQDSPRQASVGLRPCQPYEGVSPSPCEFRESTQYQPD